MDIVTFRDYCIAKPGTTEEFPFDHQTLVFKVLGKMYALTNVDLFESINLKCDPEYAIELREKYTGIKPGYHMNKKHWNTVGISDDVPDNKIIELIDHSYQLVVAKLPQSHQKKLKDF